MESFDLDPGRLARLIEVGRGLLSELEPEVVLDRVLETARELTEARYAALGILDDERRELARFVTRGVDDATHRAIGELPRGRGILGVLIDDPRPMRLHDVGVHPRSYGFPPGHPPMRTFLGVPIAVRGQAWGNLYLTEKAGGEDFTGEDEAAVTVLAGWAAVAIENARLFRAARARREELEQAVQTLEASAAIAHAVGGETELGGVLELVAKRGRALVEARDVLILLRERGDLVVHARAGYGPHAERRRVAIAGSTLSTAMGARGSVRIEDVDSNLRPPSDVLGVPDASTALVVPLLFRGEVLGLLVAFDRLTGDGQFTHQDERLLEAFAVQAATAVAGAQTVRAERLRRTLQGAEEERRRWARELHDETLQGLAGIRMQLSLIQRETDPDEIHAAVGRAMDEVTGQVESLRAMISELRPPALDELGLGPALTSLAERMQRISGVEVESEVELGEDRLSAEMETTVYRIAQEALSNVVKHAGARSAQVDVRRRNGAVRLTVADDGVGVGARGERAGGFGLMGMRERVALAGGQLDLDEPADGGTVVTASLPLER